MEAKEQGRARHANEAHYTGRKVKELDKSVRRNTRDHRRGLLRYEPKKGGGGGKFTWGRPGEDYSGEPRVIDARDPLYDPSQDDLAHIAQESRAALREQALEAIVSELFSSGSTAEAARCLFELELDEEAIPDVVTRLVLAGIEHRDADRELVSQLLSDIHGTLVSHAHLAAAFDKVLDQLEDLTLDVPDADVVAGKFMARAVADDILAPRFVQEAAPEQAAAVAAVTLARRLLSSPDGIFRLHTIWGQNGGLKPVNLLVQRMQQIATDYFASGDLKDTAKALAELDVPHFNHEFVYEVVIAAIEQPNERLKPALELLVHLGETNVVTHSQSVAGLGRIADDLHDIELDVPHAATFLKSLLGAAADSGLLTPAAAADLAQRAQLAANHGNGAHKP